MTKSQRIIQQAIAQAREQGAERERTRLYAAVGQQLMGHVVPSVAKAMPFSPRPQRQQPAAQEPFHEDDESSALPEHHEPEQDDDGSVTGGQTNPHQALLMAMLDYAIQEKEAGRDPQKGIDILHGLFHDPDKLAELTQVAPPTVHKSYWALVEKSANYRPAFVKDTSPDAHPEGVPYQTSDGWRINKRFGDKLKSVKTEDPNAASGATKGPPGAGGVATAPSAAGGAAPTTTSGKPAGGGAKPAAGAKPTSERGGPLVTGKDKTAGTGPTKAGRVISHGGAGAQPAPKLATGAADDIHPDWRTTDEEGGTHSTFRAQNAIKAEKFRKRFSEGDLNAGDFDAVKEHIGTLTVRQLRAARLSLRASFGGASHRKAMVDALRNHVASVLNVDRHTGAPLGDAAKSPEKEEGSAAGTSPTSGVHDEHIAKIKEETASLKGKGSAKTPTKLAEPERDEFEEIAGKPTGVSTPGAGGHRTASSVLAEHGEDGLDAYLGGGERGLRAYTTLTGKKKESPSASEMHAKYGESGLNAALEGGDATRAYLSKKPKAPAFAGRGSSAPLDEHPDRPIIGAKPKAKLPVPASKEALAKLPREDHEPPEENTYSSRHSGGQVQEAGSMVLDAHKTAATAAVKNAPTHGGNKLLAKNAIAAAKTPEEVTKIADKMGVKVPTPPKPTTPVSPKTGKVEGLHQHNANKAPARPAPTSLKPNLKPPGGGENSHEGSAASKPTPSTAPSAHDERISAPLHALASAAHQGPDSLRDTAEKVYAPENLRRSEGGHSNTSDAISAALRGDHGHEVREAVGGAIDQHYASGGGSNQQKFARIGQALADKGYSKPAAGGDVPPSEAPKAAPTPAPAQPSRVSATSPANATTPKQGVSTGGWMPGGSTPRPAAPKSPMQERSEKVKAQAEPEPTQAKPTAAKPSTPVPDKEDLGLRVAAASGNHEKFAALHEELNHPGVSARDIEDVAKHAEVPGAVDAVKRAGKDKAARIAALQAHVAGGAKKPTPSPTPTPAAPVATAKPVAAPTPPAPSPKPTAKPTAPVGTITRNSATTAKPKRATDQVRAGKERPEPDAAVERGLEAARKEAPVDRATRLAQDAWKTHDDALADGGFEPHKLASLASRGRKADAAIVAAGGKPKDRPRMPHEPTPESVAERKTREDRESKRASMDPDELAASIKGKLGDDLISPKEREVAEKRRPKTGTITGNTEKANAPAPEQPQRHEAHQRLKDAIDSGAGLTDEHKATYHAAVDRVAGSLPKAAHDRVAKHMKNANFHADLKGLTQAIVDKHGAKMAPAARDKIQKQLESGKNLPGGAFVTTTGEMHVDGMQDRAKGGKHGGSLPAHGVYAHELGHAIDGPNHEISKSAEWQEAFAKEIQHDKAKGEAPLTEYAGTSPHEGLAEFNRLVHGSDVPHSQIAKEFPLATAVFDKHGLWPDKDKHRTGPESEMAEAFDKDKRIELDNKGSHADVPLENPQSQEPQPTRPTTSDKKSAHLTDKSVQKRIEDNSQRALGVKPAAAAPAAGEMGERIGRAKDDPKAAKELLDHLKDTGKVSPRDVVAAAKQIGGDSLVAKVKAAKTRAEQVAAISGHLASDVHLMDADEEEPEEEPDAPEEEEDERSDEERFSDAYDPYSDDPAEQARNYIKAAHGEHDEYGVLDHEQLSPRALDAIPHDLAELPPHELAHHLIKFATHNHSAHPAVQMAHKAAELAAQKAGHDKHPELESDDPTQSHFMIHKDDVDDDQWDAIHKAAKIVPGAARTRANNSLLVAHNSPLHEAIKGATGKDDIGRGLHDHTAHEDLFNDLNTGYQLPQSNVPESAKDFGGTSGSLHGNNADDFNPHATDVYRRVSPDWYVKRRSDGDQEVDSDKAKQFEMVHGDKVPPLSRLPDPYWKNFNTDAGTDSDLVNTSKEREAKRSPEGAEQKKAIKDHKAAISKSKREIDKLKKQWHAAHEHVPEDKRAKEPKWDGVDESALSAQHDSREDHHDALDGLRDEYESHLESLRDEVKSDIAHTHKHHGTPQEHRAKLRESVKSHKGRIEKARAKLRELMDRHENAGDPTDTPELQTALEDTDIGEPDSHGFHVVHDHAPALIGGDSPEYAHHVGHAQSALQKIEQSSVPDSSDHDHYDDPELDDSLLEHDSDDADNYDSPSAHADALGGHADELESHIAEQEHKVAAYERASQHKEHDAAARKWAHQHADLYEQYAEHAHNAAHQRAKDHSMRNPHDPLHPDDTGEMRSANEARKTAQRLRQIAG